MELEEKYNIENMLGKLDYTNPIPKGLEIKEMKQLRRLVKELETARTNRHNELKSLVAYSEKIIEFLPFEMTNNEAIYFIEHLDIVGEKYDLILKTLKNDLDISAFVEETERITELRQQITDLNKGVLRLDLMLQVNALPYLDRCIKLSM